MNANVKAVIITVVVIGVLLGTIGGLGELRKFEKSQSIPESYKDGTCTSDCHNLVPFSKSNAQEALLKHGTENAWRDLP